MKTTAVVGRNGSGKTLYIDRLRKQLASDRVRYIAFTDSYGVNVDGQYYLQLRWYLEFSLRLLVEQLHIALVLLPYLALSLPRRL